MVSFDGKGRRPCTPAPRLTSQTSADGPMVNSTGATPQSRLKRLSVLSNIVQDRHQTAFSLGAESPSKLPRKSRDPAQVRPDYFPFAGLITRMCVRNIR
jgi:hypothetical protein